LFRLWYPRSRPDEEQMAFDHSRQVCTCLALGDYDIQGVYIWTYTGQASNHNI